MATIKALFPVVPLFLVLSCFLLGVAWFSWKSTREFMRSSLRVTGEVIDNESKEERRSVENGPDRDVTVYSPVVRYTDLHGVACTFRLSNDTRDQPFPIGDQLKIRYRPKHYADARIDKLGSIYKTTIITFVVGLAFFVGGVVVPILKVF